jgi:hypothetical protein
MAVNGIGTVALFALVLTLGGCGCGGTEGDGGTAGFAGPSAQAPGPDRSLIGPANAPVGGSATEESAVVFSPSHAGTLTQIDLLLSRGPVPGPVLLEVRRALGDVPDSDPAAPLLSIPFDSGILSPVPGLATLDLSGHAVAVEPGQRYAVVLRSSGGSAVWWRTSTDQAAFAHAAVRARPAPGAPWGPWQASYETEFSFQTWMTP